MWKGSRLQQRSGGADLQQLEMCRLVFLGGELYVRIVYIYIICTVLSVPTSG